MTTEIQVQFQSQGWDCINILHLTQFFFLEQISIARGDPISASLSYKSTLKKVDFTEDEYNLGLHLPNVDFVKLGVQQLVSVLQKAFYCKHGG